MQSEVTNLCLSSNDCSLCKLSSASADPPLPVRQTQCFCQQAAKVLRDISVQQLLLYWQASNPEEQPSKTSSMESDAWQHVEHPVSGTSKPLTHDTQHQPGLAGVRSNSSVLLEEDNVSQILPPTNCDLRISMKTDKHTGVTRLGAVALVERVQLQLHKDQICDIARMQDQYAVWNLHNQYGVLRPTGWRSHPGTNVSPRSACHTNVACAVKMLTVLHALLCCAVLCRAVLCFPVLCCVVMLSLAFLILQTELCCVLLAKAMLRFMCLST